MNTENYKPAQLTAFNSLVKPRWITPSNLRPISPLLPPFPPLFPQVNGQARGKQGGEAKKKILLASQPAKPTATPPS